MSIEDLKAEAEKLKLDLTGEETEAEIQALIDAAKIMDANKAEVPPEIEIVTIGIGAFPIEGIVPIGTRRTIKASTFSGVWMKPATKKDATVLAKLAKGA